MRRLPKPGKLLPPNPRQDLPLLFVMTILVFLACLSILAARTTFRAAEVWTGGIMREMTVKILDSEVTAVQAKLAEENLAQLPWVASAKLMSRQQAELLIEPWFGQAIPKDLPLPRLIAIKLAEEAPADAAGQLAENLQILKIAAEIDDHQRWANDVVRTSGALRSLAVGTVVLLIVAAAGVIIFATHAGMVSRKDVVEVMHTIGATRLAIARLFADRFMSLGLRAGLLGAAMAALISWLLARAASISAETALFLPQIKLFLSDLLILLFIPLAAAMIAMITAAFTVWIRLSAEKLHPASS